MSTPLRIAWTPEYLDWRLGEGHPTNPERARLAVGMIVEQALEQDVPVTIHRPEFDWDGVEEAAWLVHDAAYVESVRAGRTGEWSGTQPRLGEVAALMFQGTLDLVDLMAADRAAGHPGVYFNPQGAKHHARRDRASGFCVLNDMAWAAQHLTDQGLRVLYVDWDAHHGDGVEGLLLGNPSAITASIHDGTIFPGTGRDGHDAAQGAYNWALAPESGDMDLVAAVLEVLALAEEFRPDVVLLAAGADGMAGDPLSTLGYSRGGISKSSWAVGHWCGENEVPLLIGGAGGYRPHDLTPQAWAWTIENAHQAFVSGVRRTFDLTGSQYA